MAQCNLNRHWLGAGRRWAVSHGRPLALPHGHGLRVQEQSCVGALTHRWGLAVARAGSRGQRAPNSKQAVEGPGQIIPLPVSLSPGHQGVKGLKPRAYARDADSWVCIRWRYRLQRDGSGSRTPLGLRRPTSGNGTSGHFAGIQRIEAHRLRVASHERERKLVERFIAGLCRIPDCLPCNTIQSP